MLFGFLTLFTALAISAVAIWYSVVGLAAIFASAVVPIVIMGSVLEISKLVTVVWLHRFWHECVWWLRTYLVLAVVILMCVTSMGIFGFLSNAHVQQTAKGDSAIAQIERIESEIERQQDIVSRSESAIEKIQTQGVGGDSNIQSQIDREQERIDRAYERAEPAIQEQRDIIQRQEGRILDQIGAINSDIDRVDSAIASGEVAVVQTIVGIQADGIFGPNTRQAIEDFRERKSQEKQELETRLSQVNDDPRVQDARREIERIRSGIEDQVAQSSELINRLRSQLGTSSAEDIDAEIDEQTARIRNANQLIDSLTEERFELESSVRQLEAEVGPIKYIAEFIYDDPDRLMLEDAVRWVIIVLILVFDPLAVLLLIASQYTFKWSGKDLFDIFTPSPTPPTVPTGDTEKSDRVVSTDVPEQNSWISHPQWTETQQDSIYESMMEPTISVDTSVINSELNNKLQTSDGEQKESEEFVDNFYVVDPKISEVVESETSSGSDIRPQELSTGYIELNGKRYTRDAFRNLFPKIELSDDVSLPTNTNAGFGTTFPDNPEKGDVFLRVDYLPTKLFKWNGQKWIIVDKELSDHYAYHDAYLDHLIEKISSGEYDPDLLTHVERSQIEERIKSKYDE